MDLPLLQSPVAYTGNVQARTAEATRAEEKGRRRFIQFSKRRAGRRGSGIPGTGPPGIDYGIVIVRCHSTLSLRPTSGQSPRVRSYRRRRFEEAGSRRRHSKWRRMRLNLADCADLTQIASA